MKSETTDYFVVCWRWTLVSHGRPKARKDYDKGARVKLWKYFSILSSCAKCFERYGSSTEFSLQLMC